jgi:hypothetical protein
MNSFISEKEYIQLTKATTFSTELDLMPTFRINTFQNRTNVICGMSPEICLAKTVAFKQNSVYQGWKVDASYCNPTSILDTIKSICNYYTKEKNFSFDSAMFNPGFCSVPYITLASNMLYLPSQILVGFNRFQDLKRAITVANEQGIPCYAVAGYDACIPNKLVAWIKFLSIPAPFIDLCLHFNISKILTLCVHDENGQTTGENIIRLAYRHKNDLRDNCVYPNDIYFLYINESYSLCNKIDSEIFIDLVDDIIDSEFYNLANQPKRTYMSDWESGIDTFSYYQPINKLTNCSYSYEIKTTKGSIQGLIYTVKDSIKLYELATPISKALMNQNNIDIKGLVLNPYFISDPSYELNYGYLPLLYWQGNKDNNSILSQRCHKYLSNEKNKNLKIYANTWAQVPIPSLNVKDFYLSIEKVIVNSSSLCEQSADWIQAHKPKEYNWKFLTFNYLVSLIHSELI